MYSEFSIPINIPAGHIPAYSVDWRTLLVDFVESYAKFVPFALPNRESFYPNYPLSPLCNLSQKVLLDQENLSFPLFHGDH